MMSATTTTHIQLSKPVMVRGIQETTSTVVSDLRMKLRSRPSASLGSTADQA